jgi:uncharacterized protein (TIGR02284 family)
MANDDKDYNLDPISREPGSHPVGTGLGAAAGGAAVGVAAGAVAGPVGAAVGAVVGAVAGGIGGKAAAESLNPTAEEAYWQSAYDKEAYYEPGRVYEDYAPAYRMGMYARGEYQGSFDDAEPQLSSNWESRRETSTLDWPEARSASRAAWDRVDLARRRPAAGGDGMDGNSALSDTSDDAMDRDDVVDTLNDLLECSRDGEYGFRECAELASSGEIKNLMGRRANQCEESARELQTLIRQYGGEANSGGTVSGAMHRGWVSVRGMLSGHSDYAMLEECERGEDTALGRYRKALKENLPADVRTVVVRQCEGVQRNHDDIKARRDAVRVTS